ncbi:hypothetical protein Q0M94_16795 [Deinococcus radiomollis]
MNALHSHPQFSSEANRRKGDLRRGFEAGVSFVLLDSKNGYGERDSLT